VTAGHAWTRAMKRLLLSLGLVGIVFAGHTPSPIHSRDTTPAAPNERAAAKVVDRAEDAVWDQPKLQGLPLQRVALRAGEPQPDGLPEADVKDIFKPALAPVLNREEKPDQGEADANAPWVVVTRGAWMHKGPSVSTPIVGHYSPNTDLQMIGSDGGWFEVLDPTTGERGWILARYYLEPIDAPGEKRVAVRTEEVPVTASAPAASPPSRPAPRTKRWVQASRLAPPDGPQPRAVPVRRPGEGVDSILARALQR
jgi:hypothetical protein